MLTRPRRYGPKAFTKALAALIATGLIASPATAASLSLPSDDTAVLSVLGETLTLPTKDSAHIFFRPVPTAVFCGRPDHATLEAWIKDPDFAACMQSSRPTERSDDKRLGVSIGIRPFQDGDEIYPGRIKAFDIPRTATGLVALHVQVGNTLHFGLSCQSKGAAVQERFGFEQRPLDVHRNIYFLASHLRKRQADRSVCVVCTPVFGTCSIEEISSDLRVALTLKWSEPQPFDGPTAAWATYDDSVRRIADAIFQDRQAGDVQ